MEIKYLDDYIDELSNLYPQIEKKELRRMLKESLPILNKYMRFDLKGFSVGAGSNLSGENKRQFFEVNKISNRKGRRRLSRYIKNKNRIKSGE